MLPWRLTGCLPVISPEQRVHTTSICTALGLSLWLTHNPTRLRRDTNEGTLASVVIGAGGAAGQDASAAAAARRELAAQQPGAVWPHNGFEASAYLGFPQ